MLFRSSFGYSGTPVNFGYSGTPATSCAINLFGYTDLAITINLDEYSEIVSITINF